MVIQGPWYCSEPFIFMVNLMLLYLDSCISSCRSGLPGARRGLHICFMSIIYRGHWQICHCGWTDDSKPYGPLCFCGNGSDLQGNLLKVRTIFWLCNPTHFYLLPFWNLKSRLSRTNVRIKGRYWSRSSGVLAAYVHVCSHSTLKRLFYLASARRVSWVKCLHKCKVHVVQTVKRCSVCLTLVFNSTKMWTMT